MTSTEGRPSSLQRSADRTMETAKWVTAALAVLGGVLTAGMQPSNLRSLPPSSRRWLADGRGGAKAAVGTWRFWPLPCELLQRRLSAFERSLRGL